jgi:hypothetical protein
MKDSLIEIKTIFEFTTLVISGLLNVLFSKVKKLFVRKPRIRMQEVLVPTFEIASNPEIQLSEIRQRRFHIIDRTQIRARQDIQAEEDRRIFDALAACVGEYVPPPVFDIIGFKTSAKNTFPNKDDATIIVFGVKHE